MSRTHALRKIVTATFVSIASLLAQSETIADTRAPADTLPPWLASVANGDLARAHWGVAVYDLDANRWVTLHNADRFFMPASNLKLVVSAAALDRLGADYTYRTSLYATDRPRDGVIDGDLVLYGRGDPNLSARHAPAMTSIFEWLADSLAARGVTRVTGDLVADETRWKPEYVHPDWSGFDLMWWYAAPVGPLGFNDNSVDVWVGPAPRVGEPPEIRLEPASAFYTFRNEAVTGAAGAELTFDLKRDPGTNVITAFGVLPIGTPPDIAYVSVTDPAGYAGTVLREVLADRGIRVEGRVRTVSNALGSAVVRGDTIALASHVSPPLSVVLQAVNGRSQNWHAEQVLKTLARETRGDASWETGLAIEREVLASLGVDTTAFKLRDASGLSSSNLATPRALAQLLIGMHAHEARDAFVASLPVAGKTGSLSRRFKKSAAQGRVRAKSGFIANVYALSGYLTTTEGETYVFSILVNGARRSATAAIDRLVEAFVLGWAP